MSTEHVLLQDIQPPAGAPSPAFSAEIIDSQVHIEPSNATFASIYRFATVLQRCVLLVSALCAVIAGAAMPLVTVVFGALVDEFIGALQHGQDTSEDIAAKVQHLTLFLVYIAIGSFVTTLVSTWGFNLVGEQITADLQQRLLVSVLQQNIAYFDAVGTGQLTSQIDSDMKLIQEGISQKVAFIISGMSGFVIALVIAFFRNRQFAGIMFSQPVALLLLVGVLGSWLSRTHRRAVDHYAMADNLAQEVFSAMRTVISYRSQWRYARKYHDRLKVPASLDFQERLIFGIVVAGSFTLLHWANGLGIWQAEHLIHKGRCTLPEALTIIYATTVAGGMLCQALPFLVPISQAAGAARRIFSVIERVSPINPMHKAGMTLDPVQGKIRFEDVSFAYPSQPERTILHGISFEVPAGHTVALVGPSGSGKSTVFSLLERLYLPLSGRITLDHEPIEELDVSWLRSQIGYVDQSVRLFHGSIHDNIAYGLHGSATEGQDASLVRHQVIQAAETAQIHHFIVGLPHGYDTIIGVNGLGLSGGQRQQLAIARAIVSQPAILLLDEATAALDSQSEKEVQETLSHAMVGRSTIVIAHRLSTIKNADRIIVLQDGQVMNQGSHTKLLSKSGMYQELVRKQTLQSRDGFDDDQKPDEKPSARALKDPVENISIEPESANMLEDPSSSSTPRNSIRLVWSLNRPEAYYIVAGVIFSILAGMTYPIQAIFFGNGIISIINPQLSTAGHTVHFWALAYLIHGIVVFAIYCIRGYCFAVSASELNLRARSSLFKCLALKNLPFFETQDHLVGALVSFLTSGTQRIIGISGTSLGLVAESTIMLATGIVVGCVFGWKLGLAAMAMIPLISISGFLQYYIVAQAQKRIKHQVNAVAVAHEAFSAIRAVTIFNLQTTVSKAFTRARDRDNQGGYWMMAAAMYACTTALRILCIAFVFWFGGVHLIATGEYDIQQFFICFAATVWGSQSASALFAHAPDIAGAHAAAQQLQEYMQDSRIPSPKDKATLGNNRRSVPAVTDNMTMEDVRFGYPTHPFQLTLDGVSLDIPAGAFVALVGATGSGKSSVINLLSRFYSPESGKITLGGNSIHEYDLDDYYGYLALVDQNPCLIGQDLRECLQSDDRVVSDDDILEALRSVGLACFVASLPQGLNTPVSANGSTLSGGQRQRMAIAKALLWEPKILLLDEATSSLDIASEQLVQDAIQTAMTGRTTIAIAHRLKTIVNADKIHVFDHGCIIETGTHDELMEKRGKYWTMAMLQHL